MTAYLLINHIINFLLPAAVVAVLLVLLTRIFGPFLKLKTLFTHTALAQAAIIFVVSSGVLVAGLVVFGRDGKMLTYAAMVLSAAVCQWVLVRGWSA